jgi:hypothetical protein
MKSRVGRLIEFGGPGSGRHPEGVQYTDIGHDENKQGAVWKYQPDYGFEEESQSRHKTFGRGKYWGRVDHNKKAISVTSLQGGKSGLEEKVHQNNVKMIEKHFSKKYPGYSIYHFHQKSLLQ